MDKTQIMKKCEKMIKLAIFHKKLHPLNLLANYLKNLKNKEFLIKPAYSNISYVLSTIGSGPPFPAAFI